MAVLEKTVRIYGRTPEEVFAFCLDGANFPGFFQSPSGRLAWLILITP